MKLTVDDIMKLDPCWYRWDVEEAFGRRKSASLNAIFKYLRVKERYSDAAWIVWRLAKKSEKEPIWAATEKSFKGREPSRSSEAVAWGRATAGYWAVVADELTDGNRKAILASMKPVFDRYA